MTNKVKNLISFLKLKVKQHKKVKTIYCDPHFLSLIRLYPEYIESDIKSLILKDVYGRIWNIDIVVSSYFKNRIIFSSKKHIKENPSLELLRKDIQKFRQEVKEIKERLLLERFKKAYTL